MARGTMRVLAGLGVLMLAMFMIGVAPASAWPGVSGSEMTEDNDSNDNGTPNNVSDDGDNAHPSGKDRSVENGGSGNQGNSQSDPDGDSNGGPDKADGSGGVDKADQDGNNGCGNDDDFEDDNNGNCGGPDKDEVKGRSCPESGDENSSKGKGKNASKGKGMNNSKKCGEVLSTDAPCTEGMGAGHKNCDRDDGSVSAGASAVCADEATMGDSEACEDTVAANVLEAAASASDDTVLGSVLSRAAAATAGASVQSRSGAGLLPFTGAGIVPFLLLGGVMVGAGFLLMKMRSKSTQG